MRCRIAVTVVGLVVAAATSESVVMARDAGGAKAATRHAQLQSVPGDGSKLAIRATQLVILTRADVRAVVSVPRHQDNRVLRVVLESENYYRLSDIQLDGEDAPQNHLVYWRDVPSGSYRVTVRVYGTSGLRGSTSIGSVESTENDR